jgi:16S rRNA (guanine527-N7)-methyltransferase
MEPATVHLLEQLGIPDSSRKPIEAWLALLRQWNARIDLTAARTDEELFDLMLADAAVLAKHLAKDARVVDVGTGAGAPGLALGLLRPDLKVTLVEPLMKRISFLRTVIGSLGRTDIVLVRDRVEDLVKKNPPRQHGGHLWDVAISRATLAPPAWIPMGLSLAPTAWALLAREEPPEIEGCICDEDVSYVWPLTKVERRAVAYRNAPPRDPK